MSNQGEDHETCPTCGGRGWHTAGGNDPMACGRCAAGEAWSEGHDHEDDDRPKWLSLKGLSYKGGGVMRRRTP